MSGKPCMDKMELQVKRQEHEKKTNKNNRAAKYNK